MHCLHSESLSLDYKNIAEKNVLYKQNKTLIQHINWSFISCSTLSRLRVFDLE